MSKTLKRFYEYLIEEGMYKKLFGKHTPGKRIVPPQAGGNDEKYQWRLDAGPVVDGQKQINLQINSQAKNEALKKYKQKHGTDAKVATATVPEDTPKEDYRKVFDGFWGNMDKQVKDK
ncbi:MAG: hypothetical protein Q9174_003976, partial [Haloplaca sp. 1 TL-2023]